MKSKFLLAIAIVSATAVVSNAETKYLDIIGDNKSWDDVNYDNSSKIFEGTNWYNAPIIPNYLYSGAQIGCS